MSVRVLLVDDSELVREGFRMVLETGAGVEVVGEAGDGATGVAEAERLRPDVVLMDVRMPALDGIEATRRIVALDGPPVRVLMLTTFDLERVPARGARRGRQRLRAQGHAARGAARRHLRGRPRRRAGRSRDDGAADRVGDAQRPGGRALDGLAALTAQERELLAAIARGGSNAEIGASARRGRGAARQARRARADPGRDARPRDARRQLTPSLRQAGAREGGTWVVEGGGYRRPPHRLAARRLERAAHVQRPGGAALHGRLGRGRARVAVIAAGAASWRSTSCRARRRGRRSPGWAGASTTGSLSGHQVAGPAGAVIGGAAAMGSAFGGLHARTVLVEHFPFRTPLSAPPRTRSCSASSRSPAASAVGASPPAWRRRRSAPRR